MTLPARHGPWRKPVTTEMEEFFDRMGRFLESSAPSWAESGGWSALTDLRETDEAYQVDPDDVHATLADGVLTVTVPKARDARARRIRIEG